MTPRARSRDAWFRLGLTVLTFSALLLLELLAGTGGCRLPLLPAGTLALIPLLGWRRAGVAGLVAALVLELVYARPLPLALIGLAATLWVLWLWVRHRDHDLARLLLPAAAGAVYAVTIGVLELLLWQPEPAGWALELAGAMVLLSLLTPGALLLLSRLLEPAGRALGLEPAERRPRWRIRRSK